MKFKKGQKVELLENIEHPISNIEKENIYIVFDSNETHSRIFISTKDERLKNILYFVENSKLQRIRITNKKYWNKKNHA